ncbi:MAG: NAD(P)-dependent oxidoreductase [Cyclobacteriaceae bacterium]
MKSILLTGATGFLGSHLLENFISSGFDVGIIRRSSSDLFRVKHLVSKIKCFDADEMTLQSVFRKFDADVVVHTACDYGRTSHSTLDVVNSNLIFGLELIEEAIKNNVKTFVNTDTLLPRDIDDYSLSKAQFSEWLKKHSSKIQIVNLSIEHMYGPMDSGKKFVPWLLNEMVNKTGDIHLTSGTQKRDFVYIDDVVSAYNLVLNERPRLGNWNEFDVGTNVFAPVKEFVLKMAREIEKKNEIDVVPRLKFGVIEYRKGEVMQPNLDNSKLVNLGWKPKFELRIGIENVVNAANSGFD